MNDEFQRLIDETKKRFSARRGRGVPTWRLLAPPIYTWSDDDVRVTIPVPRVKRFLRFLDELEQLQHAGNNPRDLVRGLSRVYRTLAPWWDKRDFGRIPSEVVFRLPRIFGDFARDVIGGRGKTRSSSGIQLGEVITLLAERLGKTPDEILQMNVVQFFATIDSLDTISEVQREAMEENGGGA